MRTQRHTHSINHFIPFILVLYALIFPRLQAQNSSANLASNLVEMANSFQDQHKYDLATGHYAKAAKVYMGSRTWDRYLFCQNKTAFCLAAMGRHDAALELAQKNIKETKLKLGKNHIEEVKAYVHLGTIHSMKKDWTNAKTHYNKALTSYRKNGQHYLDVYAAILNNLGNVHINIGDTEEGLRHYEDAMKIDIAIYGENSAPVATDYSNIGLLHYSKCSYGEAIRNYNKSQQILEKVYGKGHPKIAQVLNNIGIAQRSLGQYTESIDAHKKALQIAENHQESKKEDSQKCYANLAAAYCEKGDIKKGMFFYMKSKML